MFKRVKSLVLAGALVLGMAVPVFAEGEGTSTKKTTLEVVTENYFNSMKALGSYITDNGISVRTITRDDYVSEKEWQDFITGINTEKQIEVEGVKVDTNNRLVITTYDKGVDNPPYKQYEVYFDTNSDNKINDGDTLIEIINIEINNEAVQGKGIFDIISPETGDMIAYGGLAIAAIAGAGLYISNKKRK